MLGLGPDRKILRDRVQCGLCVAGAHAARPRYSRGLRPAQKRDREALGTRAHGVACDGDDGLGVKMSISRVVGRLLLVPFAGVLAGCAATLVAFFANWNMFLSVIGGDAMTSGDVLAIMVGMAMLLVSSAATFPMLLPAVIGVTISEALALRSVVFHTLNGVV